MNLHESTFIPSRDATPGCQQPLCCQDCEGLGPLPGQLPAVLHIQELWIKSAQVHQISGKTKCAALAGQGGVLLREVCGCMRNPFCFVFGFSAVRRIGSSSSPSFTFKKVKRSNSFQEHSSLQQLTSAKGVADVWMSVCTPLSWCCATALRT